MLTNGKFWAGAVAGVVVVYAYHWYTAKRASQQ